MRRWILPNAHTTNTRGIMTTITTTKTDKQALEDWREIKRLHRNLCVNESLLKTTEKHLKKSREETKRLQEICESDLQEIKNLKDLFNQKSKLFKENYGKFVQLKLSI